MAGLVVKPRARILHGHDWVFASEVLKTFGKPSDGDVISLKDGRDHLIGSAIYNSKSQIIARRFSRRKQDLDTDFFTRRIEQGQNIASDEASIQNFADWSGAKATVYPELPWTATMNFLCCKQPRWPWICARK